MYSTKQICSYEFLYLRFIRADEQNFKFGVKFAEMQTNDERSELFHNTKYPENRCNSAFSINSIDQSTQNGNFTTETISMSVKYAMVNFPTMTYVKLNGLKVKAKVKVFTHKTEFDEKPGNYYVLSEEEHIKFRSNFETSCELKVIFGYDICLILTLPSLQLFNLNLVLWAESLGDGNRYESYCYWHEIKCVTFHCI